MGALQWPLQPMTEARLLEALDAWNSHDVERVLEYMTEDATYHASVGPELCGRTYRGREEVREGVGRFFERYPDGRFERTIVTVAGDRGHAEWTFTATQDDGSRFEVRGCDLFEFQGGLIRTKNAFRKVRE
jgi:ketosteroid isomerase-like protein